MPAHTFPYLLPWLLAAALFLTADIRDRAARKRGLTGTGRGPLGVRWSSTGLVVGGSLTGSALGSWAASEFRAPWVVLCAVSFLVVSIALTRLLGRAPGAGATAALTAAAALASFVLARSGA